jgi:hypothetical protein
MKQRIVEEHHTDADGNPTGGTSCAVGMSIMWQSGPLGRGGERSEPNGAFVEGVLQAALGRLEFYQTASGGRFACDENATAIEHVKGALAALDRRTQRREQRGVEGTHTP